MCISVVGVNIRDAKLDETTKIKLREGEVKLMVVNKKGFTLIELLIVVAIIAILAAIAIPNFLAAQTRAKVSGVMKEEQTVATGLEAYQVDNTAYPMSGESYYGMAVGVKDICRIQRLVPLTTPIAYLSRVPMDIFNIKGNSAAPPYDVWTGPWDRAYPYWCPKRFDGYKTNPADNVIFTDVPSEHDKIGRWALMSFGPDQNYSITIVGWPGEIKLYDPTNGIVSNGDIWRFGP